MPSDKDPQDGAGPDAPVFEPSTLFLFWPEQDPPLDEELRLALQAAFPGLTWSEELESGGDVLWGSAYSIPDGHADVLVWAEERGDLSNGMLDGVPLDPAARELAGRARWLLGVETLLDPDDPQGSFHFHLKVLEALAVAGLPAVYDDNAVVVRAGEHLEKLAQTATPPRASTLYAIHAVAGYGGTWLHTHGLGRTGLPELDIVGLPGDNLHEGYDLIDAVVDVLLGGTKIQEDGTLLIGEDLPLRLLPLEQGLAHVSEKAVGGLRDREGDLADHGGHRRILLAHDVDAPPLRVLSRLCADAVLYKSSDETHRLKALSRERWGTFGELFVIHRDDPWRFHVKIACQRSADSGGHEHLWFEALDVKPNRIRARLISEPMDVPGMRTGDEHWHSLEQLTDWLIITPEGSYDPECAPTLLV